MNWDDVPWTPFEYATIPDDGAHKIAGIDDGDLMGVVRNSRYQVLVYDAGDGLFGRVVWLSIKTHDKSARHDWHDLQRIKNELMGPDLDAIEIFPAESKLVDTSNQYHLWVFLDFKIPFGFRDRAVAEGSFNGSVQRPFAPDARPADCLSEADVAARVAAFKVKKGGRR